MSKLGFKTDFNDDHQTSSSNPPGPPARDGSSGKDRNAISEIAVGFIGGHRRDSHSHELGKNDSKRRNHNERQNDNWDRNKFRDNLRRIANNTLQILDDGEYFPPGQEGPHDLTMKILWTNENTRYYGPDAGDGGDILESEFIKINEGKEQRNRHGNTNDDNASLKDQIRAQATTSPGFNKRVTLDNTQTPIFIGEYSTLVGARKVYSALARNNDTSVNKKIGVLNFASAKRPGGGFIDGCQAQEESLARASTLYSSLITDAASQFYTHYLKDPNNAYYTHAMVYSPGIVLFRDDSGEWRSPIEVDVLTSAAVNAGEVRREIERLRKQRVEMEYWKKRKEERRKEAERERQREENKKAKEEIAKLKKEQANSVKLKKEIKETDKGKAKEESTSSSTIIYTLSYPTQPSQAPDPDPNLTYARDLKNAEIQIEHTMYDRISRILHLFQLHKTPYLILGSFGTGVFKNRIELIATIFADLLIEPGGRFKDVFQKVVFAILGKETVRVFTEVFSRVDKRAQRGRTSKTCVFVDSFERRESYGDAKEGDEEKRMRMVRCEERRKRTQVDEASHPLFFDAAQASAVPYLTSSVATDAASYPRSSDVAQADGAAYAASFDAAHVSVASCPPLFDAAQASAIAIHYPTSTTSQVGAANPTAPDYYAIPKDAKTILTRGDEQVDSVTEVSANAPITPNVMVVDEGKDIDTAEAKSLPTGSREAQNSRSNKKEDDDFESLRLRAIAQGTIKAIKDGYVDFLDSNMLLTRHNIRQFADDTVRGTEYFEPDTPWLKWWWKGPLLGVAAESHGKQLGVAVQVLRMSTLQGAHSLSQTRPASKIGVLNFASVTQPGGEFMNGASAQDESIARSSTLYLSLQTPQAAPFYKLLARDNRGGFYSHSMIYSPSVAIFRDDNSDWLCPYHVDIVTSSAVNAGLVRKLSYGWPDNERRILSEMRERMGRILALFERSRIRNLVLGSFGTGDLQNDVGSLAKIWGELLSAPGARYADSFDQVIFAIPDSSTRRKFRTDFNVAANPPRRHQEFSRDTGSNFTNKDSTLTPHSHEALNSRSNKKDHAIDPERRRLRDIAQETIKAIKDGYVSFQDSKTHLTTNNIRQSADSTVRGTKYFKPDTPWLVEWWGQDPLGDTAKRQGKQPGVAVQIKKMSTLQGSHFLSQTRPASKIGVLNFASATQPGGEFMNGASAQEESIARSSTLHLSLQTRQATPFYELHDRDNGGGFYSHSMIYSPSVAIFRNDNGDWLCPYHVDVVTSAAVNAGLVRKLRYGWPDNERKILSEMRERMGRILALFERSGVRNLVLGSFGTGVHQNEVFSLAKIWGELLGTPRSRFADSFDQVIFAIPDSYTRRNFEMGFNAGANPPQIWYPPRM